MVSPPTTEANEAAGANDATFTATRNGLSVGSATTRADNFAEVSEDDAACSEDGEQTSCAEEGPELTRGNPRGGSLVWRGISRLQALVRCRIAKHRYLYTRRQIRRIQRWIRPVVRNKRSNRLVENDRDQQLRQQQQAFRDFMLHGQVRQIHSSPNSHHSSTDRQSLVASTANTSSTTTPNQPSLPSVTTSAKAQSAAVQAFDKAWESQWCRTRALLSAVVASLADLHHRRSRLLRVVAVQQQSRGSGASPHSSSSASFASSVPLSSSLILTPDDLALALHYTTRRYEYAWSTLRRLLAQWADDHVHVLGRRLERVLLVNGATTMSKLSEQPQIAQQQACLARYQAAARELHQKQAWGHELLALAYGSGNVDFASTPKTTATATNDNYRAAEEEDEIDRRIRRLATLWAHSDNDDDT
jgi:hypothetical protein